MLHETGSSVRVVGARLNTKCIVRGRWRGTCHSEVPVGGPARLDEAFERVEGVDLATQALRTRGQDLSKTFGDDYEMLALNMNTAAEVAWFRDDFSDTPMAELLGSLKLPSGSEGLVLPADAQTIGMRIKADRSQPSVRVTARIKNATGPVLHICPRHHRIQRLDDTHGERRLRNTPVAGIRRASRNRLHRHTRDRRGQETQSGFHHHRRYPRHQRERRNGGRRSLRRHLTMGGTQSHRGRGYGRIRADRRGR